MPTLSREQKATNDRCHDLLGLGFLELIALVAAVSRWQREGRGVTRDEVRGLISRIEGIETAGESLRFLFRKRLLLELGKQGARRCYRPTDHAIRKVQAWAGEHERAA